MKRSILNIIIDAISLVVFVVMISTGLLMKYVLPPGSGRVEMLGRGSGRFEKTIDVYMGLTRHEWGEIHFAISLLFLILLVIHLYLHWNWIKAVCFGTRECPKPLKSRIVAVCVIVFIIVGLLFPWIGKKQTYTKTDFYILKNINQK